jgi:hypothetical protein
VDRIRELIDKATEESDEPYNDSLDAYEAGEKKAEGSPPLSTLSGSG